jgi:hypothetical protein
VIHPYIARVPNSISAKMTDDWLTIGRIASTTGVTAAAYSGIQVAVKGYQTYISPNTSLAESERRLKRVQSRLQGLSTRRREEIEAATRSFDSGCKSLENLEEQLDECVVLCPLSFEFKIYCGTL